MSDERRQNPDTLVTAVLTAASSTIPRTSAQHGAKSLPWWNADVANAVKRRRTCLRRAKKCKRTLPAKHPVREAAQKAYCVAANRCRGVLNAAKRSTWADFLDGINANQTTAELWRRIRVVSGQRRNVGITLELADGTMSQDPQTVATELGRYFAELSSLARYSDEFRTANGIVVPAPAAPPLPALPHQDRFPELNVPFTLLELRDALDQCGSPAAGPDDVGYPMLKHLPPVAQQMLLDSFNGIWDG